jgi:hypothetical protein
LDAVGCCFALLRRVCWPTLEECYVIGKEQREIFKRSTHALYIVFEPLISHHLYHHVPPHGLSSHPQDKDLLNLVFCRFRGTLRISLVLACSIFEVPPLNIFLKIFLTQMNGIHCKEKNTTTRSTPSK